MKSRSEWLNRSKTPLKRRNRKRVESVYLLKRISKILYILHAFHLINKCIMNKLSPQAPKNSTVIISVVLVLLGLFGATISPVIAANGDWILLAGYVFLLLGVYVRGL